MPEEGLSESVHTVYKLVTTYILVCVKLVSLMQSQQLIMSVGSWGCHSVRQVPPSPLPPPVSFLPAHIPLLSISCQHWPSPLPTCHTVRGGIQMPLRKCLYLISLKRGASWVQGIAKGEWNEIIFKLRLLSKFNVLKPSMKQTKVLWGFA